MSDVKSILNGVKRGAARGGGDSASSLLTNSGLESNQALDHSCLGRLGNSLVVGDAVVHTCPRTFGRGRQCAPCAPQHAPRISHLGKTSSSCNQGMVHVRYSEVNDSTGK